MKRLLLFPLTILLLLVAFPAQAGGWVVFTLDELPAQVVAGEPLTIEFAVRQHGVHLTSSFGTPAVYAQHVESGARWKVEAERTARTGYFSATLLFPQPGTWTWRIGWAGNDSYAQTMPPLTVQETDGMAATPRAGGMPALTVGLIGVVTVVGAGVVFFVTRTRWALGAGLAGILLAGAAWAGLAQRPAAVVTPGYTAGEGSELGQALFMAKGCVVCHAHAQGRMGFSGLMTDVGPDLTDTPLPAEYLRVWLEDPSAIKPETQMPNLDLKVDEIEALTAFLTAK
jgi:mono/diheme cytochrome c family protein